MKPITTHKKQANRMRIGDIGPIQRCFQPRQYKLAILTFLGLLGPVYFLPPAISGVLEGPRILIVATTVAGIVVLMTYVIMPLFSRFASGWLFEQHDK